MKGAIGVRYNQAVINNIDFILSAVSDSANSWTLACQAPLSMGFSKQEYWSVLPFPSPGDLPDPWIEPRSPELQADLLSHQGSPYLYSTD